uniref:F-BAR domain-containing protein n=2 Tax=Panagrellus redivivus TaxID=6233 RepID=A0A7E4V7G5_PANRE
MSVFEAPTTMSSILSDRGSLIPVFDGISNKIHEKFKQCRTSLSFIDEIRTQGYRNSDSCRVNVDFDGAIDAFDTMTAHQMKCMVQSYADKAARALRDSAANLQRVLALQAKLTASETANARILSVFDDVDKFLVEQLDMAAEKESQRISKVKELQEACTKANSERRAFSRKLTDTTKILDKAEAKMNELAAQNDELDADLSEANRQINVLTVDLIDTQKKVDESHYQEEKLRKELTEAQNSKRKELNVVARQNSDAENIVEQLQRELKFNKDSYEKKLQDHKREHLRKERQIADICEHELRKCQINAQNAISEAVQEAKSYSRERNEFHDLYHKLLLNLGRHKEQNLAQMQAYVLKCNRELITDLYTERARSRSTVRAPLPNLSSPYVGATYTKEMHSSTDESVVYRQPLREVNTANRPGSSSTMSSRNALANVAKHYDVASRFPPRSRTPSSRR